MTITASDIPPFNSKSDGKPSTIGKPVGTDITAVPADMPTGVRNFLLEELAKSPFARAVSENNVMLPPNAISKLGESEANKLNTAAAKVGKDIANINGNRNSIRRVASLKHPMAVVSWGVASEQYLSIDFTTSADRYGSEHSNVFSFILKSQQTDTSAINKHTAGTVQMYDIYYILSMHIPPSEITYTYGKEITKNRARGVWVNEHWGDAMLSIECSGQSGVFFRQDTGLTRTYAKYTYGHYELMQMLQLYRNNGMSYDPTHGVIDTISEIVLRYDGGVYRGCFDSFNIRESADKPYNFEYDFVFVSRGDDSAKVVGHFVDVKEEGERVVSTPRLRDIAPLVKNDKGQMVVDPNIIDGMVDPRDPSDFDPKVQEELNAQYREYAKKAFPDPPPPKPSDIPSGQAPSSPPYGDGKVYPKPPVVQDNSPNFNERPGDKKIKRIILHMTAGALEGAIVTLKTQRKKDPKSETSAHYIISRGGSIIQLVPDEKQAWHCFENNEDSIGIEHECLAGQTMAPAQKAASVRLIKSLLSKYGLNKSNVTAHRFTPNGGGGTACPGTLFGAATLGAMQNWINTNL